LALQRGLSRRLSLGRIYAGRLRAHNVPAGRVVRVEQLAIVLVGNRTPCRRGSVSIEATTFARSGTRRLDGAVFANVFSRPFANARRTVNTPAWRSRSHSAPSVWPVIGRYGQSPSGFGVYA
jgi:hypothetical protein